jgi:hypothetical protein
MRERHRKGRTTARKARRAALGGALAAGVVGLSAGPADASWGPVPPSPVAIPTTNVTTVDLSAGIFQGFASISSTEEDWYTFVAPKSGVHVIWTSTANNVPDTVLGVYNSAGTLLASNDDFAAPDRDSQVQVSLTKDVQYYFGITNYINTAGGDYEYLLRAPK